MMILETALCRRLPPVSARGSVLLAGLGLVCLTLGIVAGTLLLAPAGIACTLGLVAGLTRAVRVWRGKAYAREGGIPLAAATFVNACMMVFVAIAAILLLRFGP